MEYQFHANVKLKKQGTDDDDAATIKYVDDEIASVVVTGGGMPEPTDDDKLYARSRASGQPVGTWEEVTGGGGGIAEPTDDGKVYGRSRASGATVGDWEEIVSGGAGGAVTSDQVNAGNTLTVSNALGGFTIGHVINATDTVWDIIRRLLNPRVPAQYTQPTLSLTGTAPLAREIGETLSPTLTPNWQQNHAGPITQYRLTKDGTNIYTGPSAIGQSDPTFTLTANVVYQAQADYAQGPVLADSEGTLDPAGQIQAGTLTSSSVTYTPQRRGFCGPLSDATVPSTSAFIRGLPGGMLNPQNNSSLVVDIALGGRGACFAYPATLRAATSIIQQGLGLDVKAGFTEITVSVAGANGYAGINYRVYYLITEFPFTASERFTLTI